MHYRPNKDTGHTFLGVVVGIQKHFVDFHNRIKLGKKDDAYAKAREKDDSITKEVKDAFSEAGYPVIEDFIQGSLASDTAILKKGDDFDIDRALVIEGDTAPDNPVEPKKLVCDVLEKRGFKNAKIKKPCVTADYASENLHIDFPIYKKQGETYKLAVGKRNSDENNREWSDSDPKGLKDWIKDNSWYIGSPADKQQQYNRVVRYLKRWRDEKFSESVCKKIYSIGLTVMAKRCFVPEFDEEGRPDDLKALKNTVANMLDRGFFQPTAGEQFKVEVYLPVSPYRDIYYGSSVNTGTQFKNKLGSMNSKLRDALNEENEKKQCQILNGLFGEDFHIPEGDNSSAKAKKASFSAAGLVGTSQGA